MSANSNGIEFLSSILDCLPDAAILFRDDWSIVCENESARRLFTSDQTDAAESTERIDVPAFTLPGNNLVELMNAAISREDGRIVWRFRPPGKESAHRFEVILRRIRFWTEAKHLALFRDMTELRFREDERLNSVRQLYSALQEERRDLAREVHDQIGQLLTALLFSIKDLEAILPSSTQAPLQQLGDLAAEIKKEARKLAQALRPSPLDSWGLLAGLQRHADKWAQSSGGTVDINCTDLNDSSLPVELEIALYEVLRACLNEAFDRAKAGRVSLLLDKRRDHILAMVEDYGDDSWPKERNTASDLALSGATSALLQEQVAALGGTLSLESIPGGGTTVLLRIPSPDAPICPEASK